MNHLIIISPNPQLAEAVNALLAPGKFSCLQRGSVEQARPMLENPLFRVCLLESDLRDVRPIREIETIRQVNPEIALFVVSSDTRREWEEEAYLKGADFIMGKPLRAPLLNKMISRHLDSSEAAPAPPPPPPPRHYPAERPQTMPASLVSALPALEVLRDFSRIFSYSLNLNSFVRQFVLKIREVISVNRIAIFLEKPRGQLLDTPPNDGGKHLDCVCSIGIDSDLLKYFALSSDSGIGQAVLKSGRILRAGSDPAELLFPSDPKIQREFDVLGGQIAIPILDRERAIGVAVVGERLVGHSLSNEELQILFHLMEELGMAIKSNLLHEQLLSNHKLISNVFSQMSSGCLVVDRDLNVLHANPALTTLLQLPTPVQFANLPRKLAGLLYESAHLGKTTEPFLFQPGSDSNQSYRVSIVPFQGENETAGAMMSVEDFTVVEAARQADLKASNLHMVGLMAEKFAHEIRNALVPIETCRQLIPEHKNDAAFHDTLAHTIEQETRRISRLTDQLLFLSKQDIPLGDKESLSSLLKEAFAKVKPLVPPNASLKGCDELIDYRVQCNSQSLKHAFFEVLLNGFQSNPSSPKVTVSGEMEPGSNGTHLLKLNFHDEGPGLSSDLSARATDPFFTTRNVGVGLGLSVTRKIIDDHRGKLEVRDSSQSARGSVSISLPVSIASSK